MNKNFTKEVELINHAEEIYNDELYNLFCDSECMETYEEIYKELEKLKSTNNDILSEPFFAFYKKHFRPDSVAELENIKSELENLVGSNAGL